mgnify:CR=1 FL=1|tara:strand:+ start:5119 stop:6069 length:951 start_codon:yes stop_codon:yes gene_type:complete
MWTKTEDGSIVDEAGKVIFFSARRFVDDICLGDCCLICGARPGTKPFNDEHVIPDWMLRRYQLHARLLTVSNGQQFRYDRLTIPCCAECNSLMGRNIEMPMSELVRAGHTAFNDYAVNGGLLNIFVWLGLIFLKTHLKDRSYRWHRDARLGDERISDFHTWEDLHHIHSLVRSFYNGAHVEQAAVGSFLTMPMRTELMPERFDFIDLSEGQTLMLRLDDFAVFAVFNDSGGAMNWFNQKATLITGPIAELQAREIAAELAYLNLHLNPRPAFHTETDLFRQTFHIHATRPPAPEMAPFDLGVRGALLDRAVGGLPH